MMKNNIWKYPPKLKCSFDIQYCASMIYLLLIVIFSIEICVSLQLDEYAWCPPPNFVETRQKSIRAIRTAIITEVHGELKPAKWGTLINGNLLARNMYQHLGVMGFDKMYLNYIYNDTQHPTPPTIEEMYPSNVTCVSAWFKTGTIEIRYIPYAGPVERWPLTKQGKPSLEKDLYKTLRGINPAYADIKKKNEIDWVMILDIDEYLWPINFVATEGWCSSKNPSILEMALQRMQEVATTVDLQNFPMMKKHQGIVRTGAEVCPFGSSYCTSQREPKCRPIANIIMPVRFWTKFRGSQQGNSKHVHHMPQLRSKIYASYDIVKQLNKTINNEDTQYQRWKAIHNTKNTPELVGRQTMHYGSGDTFNIIAPRDYHKGVTLEIAHIKRLCGHECLSVLVKDNILDDLASSYGSCMRSIV